jgi:hypothetical protein
VANPWSADSSSASADSSAYTADAQAGSMAFNIVGPLINTAAGLPGGNSAGLDLTSAQVLKAAPGVCVLVVCIIAGTLTLNDCATTGAAATANQFFVGALTAGQVVALNWPCGTGIVASAVSAGQFAVSFS